MPPVKTNYYSGMAHAQLLTTTTNDAASTSGSNMLMTLRKDRGTHADILPAFQARARFLSVQCTIHIPVSSRVPGTCHVCILIQNDMYGTGAVPIMR